jgi:iron complex outermembrane receptor protein
MTAGPTTLDPIPPRWEVAPSPRLSTRLSISDALALKGSIGRHVRVPTLVEVFGNRGYIVGAPELRPEHGPSSDLGFVWAPANQRRGVDRILVSANVFANRARDTIAILTYAGYAAKATNIGSTQAYGAEIIAAARIAQTLSLTTSYTRLVTEQLSADPSFHGKAVPRRPGHLLHARVDAVRSIGGHAGSLWIDGTWQATSFLDAANLGRVPGRVLLGTGARIEVGGGVAVAGSIANLTDDRITYLPLDPPPSPALTATPTSLNDLGGFPLPGRSFYLSLEWTY